MTLLRRMQRQKEAILLLSRAFWKETHTVWNPKLKVFLLSFEVQKLAKGGKVK